MTERLRFGVIGAGAFAEACHVPGLQAHPGAEVVAICGRRRERATALAARFGIPHVADDVAALLARDDLDGVSICTPNDAHRDAAVAAFARGLHVFCEKPLGLDVPEAEAMAGAAMAAASRGCVGLVAFTYRFLHGVGELRRRVLAGDVGEPYLLRAHHEFWDPPEAPIGWRELQAPSGGGVGVDSGSHFYDLARFVLGPIVAVRGNTLHLPRARRERASGETREVETDDLATAWFRFASGIEGSWHASRITPPRATNFLQVVGREGALEATLSRGRVDTLRAVRTGSSQWQEVPLPAEAAAGGSHALIRMMGSFVDACRAGRPGELDASFADGLAVQRLLAATARSHEQGWVELGAPT